MSTLKHIESIWKASIIFVCMPGSQLTYLIQAIATNGDEKAFDELFRMYYPPLLSYAISIVKDKPVAEELCVDVLFNLWKNRKTLPDIKNLSRYLYIAVKHAVISYMRSKSYRQLQKNISLEAAGEYFEYELQHTDPGILHKETLQQVNTAINGLPPRCRLIFKLVKEDGFKYTEVAHLLELSVKTVENQVLIAMKKLAEVLRTQEAGREQGS